MSDDRSYEGQTPVQPMQEADPFSDPEALWKSLSDKDRRAIYDVYVMGKLDADTSSGIFDVIQQMNKESRSNTPQQHLEALALDHFGPPAEVSKGEMYKRDATPRSKRGRGKSLPPPMPATVEPSRRLTPEEELLRDPLRRPEEEFRL